MRPSCRAQSRPRRRSDNWAGDDPRVCGFRGLIAEELRALRKEVGEDLGRGAGRDGVLRRVGRARRCRDNGLQVSLDGARARPVVGVFAVPGRDHRVIDRDVHQRQAARGEKPIGAPLHVLGRCELAPAVGWRAGIPVADLFERGLIARHGELCDLNRLLLARAAVGRRRYAEILARGDDPGFPGPTVAVGRGRLLRPESRDDTGEQQKHHAAADVHNAHRYLLS